MGGGESSFPIEEDPIHRDWLLTTTVSLFFFFFSLYSSLPFSWLSIWTPQPWASFVARLLLAGCCIPSALLRGQTRVLSLHHTAPISLSSQTYLSNLFWFLFSPLSGFIGKKTQKTQLSSSTIGMGNSCAARACCLGISNHLKCCD